MVASSLLTLVVLVTGALAAPKTNLARRLERRNRRTLLPQFVPKPEGLTGNSTHEEFSSNWAGAVFESGTGFTSVTGTFTVPTPKSNGGSGTQSASAWVGIDGDTCGSAILQTGLDFTISNGKVSYDAWYEWFPDFAHDFTGISFSAGDSVTVTVTASSKTSGTAVIKNNSKGTSVSKAVTAPSSSDALCETNAEWIVEDFEENSGLVPFANFGTVTFSNAAATEGGRSVGPSGATLIDIQQNGKVLTSSSTSSSSVTVKYTG